MFYLTCGHGYEYACVRARVCVRAFVSLFVCSFVFVCLFTGTFGLTTAASRVKIWSLKHKLCPPTSGGFDCCLF